MKIERFKKGRCIPVLPTVYEDALSYYELLCKVSKKLNDVIEAVNGKVDEETVREMIDEVYEYVDEQITQVTEGYVAKTTSANKVYGTNQYGEDGALTASDTVEYDSIVKRDHAGHVKAAGVNIAQTTTETNNVPTAKNVKDFVESYVEEKIEDNIDDTLNSSY